ncbi:uncharacterized protein PGTG_20896 [Puccinia graminis f. sp. tritici CRL 75-36-700-3]|uniref:No apical meristem-associated C-terminal domain-containing protein n=1 Tax=Puccinia graminis f. sp. tritici (strain CRL 75-36-700-3 / race SCCL) TaxID=418459 RepID=H6QPH8_PUCGT|nr:uncharacterized protein PGTG_20896 [Puccinia graminis f. sp. tritici CRL 75-36-700-3]EHS63916.1 hypothetical protein PGTG_20896 [Puccinia graminis f. sp. tritici CRL 75-36-700-3]
MASAPSVDPLLLEENPNGDENDENNAEQETDPKEKRKRAPNYQEHEDIQLCCFACYHTSIPQPRRPISSLKGHWGLISAAVNKFIGCVCHIDQLNPSRASSKDCLNKSLELYTKLQNKPFTYLRCYNILSPCPKYNEYFRDHAARTSEASKKKKKRQRSPSSKAPALNSETNNASDAESTPMGTPAPTPDQSEPERPTGKKKAKTAIRERIGKENLLKEMASAQVEMANQSNHQNNIYFTQTHTMEVMADTAIMNKDLSGLDEVTQEFYRLQRQTIMNKLREQHRSQATNSAPTQTSGTSQASTQATTSDQPSRD